MIGPLFQKEELKNHVLELCPLRYHREIKRTIISKQIIWGNWKTGHETTISRMDLGEKLNKNDRMDAVEWKENKEFQQENLVLFDVNDDFNFERISLEYLGK